MEIFENASFSFTRERMKTEVFEYDDVIHHYYWHYACSFALCVCSVFICTGQNKKEFKLHLHGKRQTSDSSLEFLKIENAQIKAAQNNSYGQKIA